MKNGFAGKKYAAWRKKKNQGGIWAGHVPPPGQAIASKGLGTGAGNAHKRDTAFPA